MRSRQSSHFERLLEVLDGFEELAEVTLPEAPTARPFPRSPALPEAATSTADISGEKKTSAY